MPDRIEYRGGFIQIGDEILVDCSAYGVPGRHWCRVEAFALGSAAVYPIKAQVPDRGLGQWHAGEVEGVRGPAVTSES